MQGKPQVRRGTVSAVAAHGSVAPYLVTAGSAVVHVRLRIKLWTIVGAGGIASSEVAEAVVDTCMIGGAVPVRVAPPSCEVRTGAESSADLRRGSCIPLACTLAEEPGV